MEIPASELPPDHEQEPTRAFKVLIHFWSIIQLSEYASGTRKAAPDLSDISQDTITPSQLARAKDRGDLQVWAEMFTTSLDNYRDILSDNPTMAAILSEFSEAEIQELEGAVEKATLGIYQHLNTDD